MKYIQLAKEDGFGATFQQIIGAIGLAEHFGLTYVHNKNICKINLAHNNTIQGMFETLIDLDQLYPAPHSMPMDINNKIDFNIDNLQNNLINTIKPVSDFIENNCLTDVYIKAAHILKHHFKPIKSIFNNNYYNIALHIRRGDITKEPKFFGRIVGIEFYIKVINKLRREHANNKPCKFFIFTQPNHLNSNELDILKQTDDVSVIIDDETDSTSAFKDWYQLTIADMLVTSKSSFSYSAAMFNSNIVHYVPFYHKPCFGWNYCITDESGDIMFKPVTSH